MIAHLLPVRPAPRPGEPLTSFAARLADANGIHRDRVLPRYRHDVDIPRPELSAITALAGLDLAATAQLTMDRYPPAVRGHGPQRRHGWRLHHLVKWMCPSCTLTAGHSELLWQTALMPVCLRCRCYLIPATATHVTAPAHPRVLDLAVLLAGMAEASVKDPRPRRALYRLRRRCLALSATVQPAHAADAELPLIDVAAARAWGAYPSSDPRTVAALLVLAGGALTRQRRRPAGKPRRSQPATMTTADRDRLAWFLTRIRHHITADDLRPCHVPTLLPAPAADQPRRPGQWLSLTRAATGLHLLISQAKGATASPDAAMRALGVPGIPGCVLIDGIHDGSGLRQGDADLLTAAMDHLLASGLVDYQRRRDTLRAVPRLPTSTTRQLSADSVPDRHGEQLALGWIWTRFTHGPMRSSRWPHLPDRDVHAFDARIDPETRLVLHEAGQQLLADADLRTIPATRTITAREYA